MKVSMRPLSSALTWFYKFVFSALWIGGFGLGTVAMFVASHTSSGEDLREIRWLFLAAWIAGASMIYWTCIRAKKVSLASDSLVISNFRRELRIPLRDVERVTGSFLWNPELIWLHFRRPNDFGSKIVFIAPMRWFPYGRHPLTRELNALVARES